MGQLVSLIITVSVLSIAVIAQEKYPGPRCLGPFCVDRPGSITQVYEQLGRPKSKSDAYCFRALDGSGFVAIEFDDAPPHAIDNVFLSDFQHCVHMPAGVMQVTSADLKKWRTREGVGLGSSEQDVIKAYGKPNFVQKIDKRRSDLVLNLRSGDIAPNVGTESLEYRLEDRTRSAEFGIRDGKVAWIMMFR